MVQTLGAVAVALVAVTGVGMLAARRHAADPSLTTGTLVVDSNPTGAQILIDGAARGVTPATVMLAAGTHAIELRGGGEGRGRSRSPCRPAYRYPSTSNLRRAGRRRDASASGRIRPAPA